MSLSDEDLDRIEKTAQAGYAEFDPTMIAALVAEVRRLRVGLDAAFAEATKEFEDSWEGHRAGLEDAIDIFARHVDPIRPTKAALPAPADTGTGRWERNGAVWSIEVDPFTGAYLSSNGDGTWSIDGVSRTVALTADDLRAAARIIEKAGETE